MTKTYKACDVKNQWCPKENVLDPEITQIYDF